MRNLLLAGFIFLYSCKSSPERSGPAYPNHQQWETGDIYSPAKLKGKPKEIIETTFEDITDTVFNPGLTGKFYNSTSYKFDKEGNLVFTRIFLDSNFINDVHYQFDENGTHYTAVSYGNGDTTRNERISKKIGNDKYSADVYQNGKKKYNNITTVSNNGNKIETVEWAGDTVRARQTSYFKEGRLVQIDDTYKGITKETRWFYSGAGFLDSIVAKRSGSLYYKDTYINNESGDPVYYEEWKSGDIEQKRWMKYAYDTAGNWVRQIVRTQGSMKTVRMRDGEKGRFPDHSVVIREIKY